MKILAVDFGDARTGVAVCDSLEMLASPVCTISERNPATVADRICEIASERAVGMLVVGLPKNMDGSEGSRALLCREFAEMLAEKSGIPTEMWDERGTTKAATYYMNATDTRGKKRKAVIDAAAASIILDSFLAHRRAQGIAP